jgi:DNA topoisomerase-1
MSSKTIARIKQGKRFIYKHLNKPITNKNILEEINKIKIPPAWRDVKITLKSKVLAVGYDEAGRKQAVYSSNHTEKQRHSKICNLVSFIRIIPHIRKDIAVKLKYPKLTKDKLIAMLLNIIIICSFRIGSEKNRKLYKSYGISTITKKEMTLNKSNVIIDFVGKKQVQNTCKIVDPQMVRLLKDLYKGKSNTDNIFSYKEGDQLIKVSNIDVNTYLKDLTHKHMSVLNKSKNIKITTKVFRTWLANVKFVDKMYNIRGNLGQVESKQKALITEVKREVAKEMHHTMAICSKSYLIKELLEMALSDYNKYKHIIEKNYKKHNGMTCAENALMEYLKRGCV